MLLDDIKPLNEFDQLVEYAQILEEANTADAVKKVFGKAKDMFYGSQGLATDKIMNAIQTGSERLVKQGRSKKEVSKLQQMAKKGGKAALTVAVVMGVMAASQDASASDVLSQAVDVANNMDLGGMADAAGDAADAVSNANDLSGGESKKEVLSYLLQKNHDVSNFNELADKIKEVGKEKGWSTEQLQDVYDKTYKSVSSDAKSILNSIDKENPKSSGYSNQFSATGPGAEVNQSGKPANITQNVWNLASDKEKLELMNRRKS